MNPIVRAVLFWVAFGACLLIIWEAAFSMQSASMKEAAILIGALGLVALGTQVRISKPSGADKQRPT
jgi:hypothetical protein